MDLSFIKCANDGELLNCYDAVVAELRERNVVRSANNPVADYAELLASRAIGFELALKSTTGYDGACPAGVRYEVKARRNSPHNRSVRLSAIRNLGDVHFHVLIGIVFNQDFSVKYALSIPHAVVAAKSKFNEHTRASILHLRPSLLDEPGVVDITDLIAKAALETTSRANKV